ncbi:MAG: hypothetical protein ACRDTF_25260 [Pseudonocardiaceae bacterium]
MAADSSFAVFDAAWWGVWWPWLLVWGITTGSLVATVVIVVGHWRIHRADADAHHPGICFYLHNESVMDLYHQKHGAALRQEVQQRITTSRSFEGSAALSLLKASGGQGVNHEVFRSYIEEEQPITVIGTIIDVLHQAGDIVDIDLLKKEVTGNRALDKALGADGDKRPTAVRLRGLKTFVSIFGEFRATDHGTSEVTTFEAPYGDPGDGPQVYLTCVASGLRGAAVPAGTFQARCLGCVEGWDPGTRRLNVRPIAIFL